MALVGSPSSPSTSHLSDPSFRARESRLKFTPSYAIVGIYRLCTDSNLYVPIWGKVKHGVQRGVIVGIIWTGLTFNIQRAFVRFFLVNSPRVTGLSEDTIFGYKVPVDIATYATVIFICAQVNVFLYFFLARNLRIARERAWDQTVKSRGKGPEFWGPYVEEWQTPPQVGEGGRWWQKWLSNGFARFIINRVLLAPLHFYPFVGIIVSSWLRSIGTARYLHKPYFAAKKMTPLQIAIFMEERKWDYRIFGFVAALLEGLPIIGLAFSISNRIGAAMWAHDLEKEQHLFASGVLPRRSLQTPQESESIKQRSLGTDVGQTKEDTGGGKPEATTPTMAGSWQFENVS